MKLISSFFIFFITLSLTGCFADDTVTFNPEVGESRRYHTIQSVELSLPGRGSEDIYANSYATFKVTSKQNNEIRMHISPGKFKANIGSRELNTAVQGDFSRRALSDLAEGADMVIDDETGEMVDVSAQGSSLRSKLSNMLGSGVDNLFKQANQPSIAASIAPKEGWKVSKTFRGVPEVQFNVTRVTEKKVWLRFDGGEASNQVAGVAVLERESGWIEHQVITSSSRQTIAGKEVAVRTTEVMARVVDGHEGYVPRLRSNFSNRWIDIPGSSPDHNIEAASDLSNIFSQKNGHVKQDEDTLSLELQHGLDKHRFLGLIEISDAQVFDENDEPINSPTHLGPTYSYNDYRNDGKISTAELSFIGLDNQVKFVNDVASVRAKVAWYPDASFTVKLTPDVDNNAQYEGRGVKINFRPMDSKESRLYSQHDDTTDSTFIYELTFEGREKDRLSFQLGNEQAYAVQYHAYPKAPKWLTSEESNLRYQASAHPEAHRVLIRTSEPPTSVNLVVERAEKEAAEVRELIFLTDKAKRFSPNVKPDTSFLFKENTPDIDIGNLAPLGIKRGQVELVVGDMQVNACTATLSPEAKEAGTPIVFKPVFNEKSFKKPASLLLQTEDGIRTYFYGLGPREVHLSCTHTAKWINVDLTLDEDSPWVVPMEKLSIPPNIETIGDLFNSYRFVDSEGRALNLIANHEDVETTPDTPLNAFVFPHNTLRIAGEPVSIQKIEMVDSPINRKFSVTLPSLPSGNEE